MRGAGVAVALLLATSAASCGRFEVVTVPHSSPSRAPAPEVARVVCEKDGSTTLLTESVVAQPDGVHVEVDNRTGEGLSLNGFALDFGEGTATQVANVPPGRIKVACYPFSMHRRPAPKGLPFEIDDPNGYWVSPELECPPGDMIASAINDFLGDGPGEQGDPVELTRENLRGLKEDDVIERAGYPESTQAVVRVVRDGNVIVTTNFHQPEGGGWNMGGYQACDSAGIREDFS
ncbi:MAG: hypothetical protein ACRDKT_03075 [Actinomycetota bacterium]